MHVLLSLQWYQHTHTSTSDGRTYFKRTGWTPMRCFPNGDQKFSGVFRQKATKEPRLFALLRGKGSPYASEFEMLLALGKRSDNLCLGGWNTIDISIQGLYRSFIRISSRISSASTMVGTVGCCLLGSMSKAQAEGFESYCRCRGPAITATIMDPTCWKGGSLPSYHQSSSSKAV